MQQTSVNRSIPVLRVSLHSYRATPWRSSLLSSAESYSRACGETQTDIIFTALARELLRRRVEVPGVDLLAFLTPEEREEYGINKEMSK